MEGLENEALLYLHHSSFSNPYIASPTSQLIFNLPSLHLRHSSFYNLSVASLTSPGEPPCYFVTSVMMVSLNAQKEFHNIITHCGTEFG